MKIYNVHEVVKILMKYYITDSIQMVTRWIREGKINAERSENRKDGWKVTHNDLFDFIEDLRPGLPEIMAVYESFIEGDLNWKENNINENWNLTDKKTLDSETLFELENEVVQLRCELEDTYNHISQLQCEVKGLKEENYFLEELYYQTDELYKEAGKSSIAKHKDESEKGESREEGGETVVVSKMGKREIIKKLSYEKFKKMFEMLPVLGNKEEAKVKILKDVYSYYFTSTEDIHPEIIDEKVGIYLCPISKKSYKNLKNLLKNGIHEYCRKFD